MVDISPKSFRATWVGIMALALFFCLPKLPAQSVTLAWNASPDTSVTGYLVDFGTDASNLYSQIDVGTNTFASIGNLQPGSTNYFEVVAYNAVDAESPPSNLIEYIVPAVPGQTKTNSTARTNSLAAVTVQTNDIISFSLLRSGEGTLVPNLKSNAFLEGKKYTLTAIAARGWVFSNWVSNGMAVSAATRYTFQVESNLAVQANFVPNPFIPVMGTYHGLFYAATNEDEESSGSIVADVTSTGFYTARICKGALSYSFSGDFSLTGAAFKTIARQGLNPLTVELQLDLTNGPMTGSVSDGNWTADLEAFPAIYSAANHAPQAGRYTMLLPGSDDASNQPGGNGFATVTVNDLGYVSLNGTLGDGTPVITSSTVCSQGQWPFYVPLYAGKGSALGWLSFTNNGDIAGQISWFKLPQKTAKLYPGGFTNVTEALGSVYKHTNGVPILGFTDGQLSLTNGDLTLGITDEMGLGTSITSTGPTGDKLTFNTTLGLFNGKVMNPETGKPITVNGVVLQNQNFAAGLFLGTNQSGSVVFSPAP
jgi:hypothetical protein